jgi:hypothetical protein
MNARRRASMNRIVSRRSEGFRRRGQGVPATFSGTSKTTAPTRAAVSRHVFDRSFAPEMDESKQRGEQPGRGCCAAALRQERQRRSDAELGGWRERESNR